jgi:hypothetical protein
MWAKFDDSYFSNRKVRSVNGMARLLHMASIIHCSAQESDGFYPKTDLALVAAMAGVEDPASAAISLMNARLLHDRGDSFEVHDFLDYNPSHAELEDKRASGAKRVKNWRGNGKRNKAGNAVSNGVTPIVSNSVCTGRPDPDLSLRDQSSEKREDPGTNAVSNGVTQKRPSGHELVTMFGSMRLEVFPNTLPWNTARDPRGEAGSFAALLSEDEIGDIKPTMRMALEKIRTSAIGWTNPELTVSPTFAFGKWKSDFTGLREELHGRRPVIEPTAASTRVGPRAGSIPENWEPAETT